MLAGSLCVGIALLPPLASHDDRFEVHVIQHLLLAMAAPVFLAISASVSLALRTVPLYRFRSRRRVPELGFGLVGMLGQDRGSCLSVCCT
jgi:cytochrome c oxidase assembly factor CtaG